jgi:hypothetical protein
VLGGLVLFFSMGWTFGLADGAAARTAGRSRPTPLMYAAWYAPTMVLLAGGGQGAVPPSDVVEAALFVFHVSANCVPEEITLKAAQPGAGAQ